MLSGLESIDASRWLLSVLYLARYVGDCILLFLSVASVQICEIVLQCPTYLDLEPLSCFLSLLFAPMPPISACYVLNNVTLVFVL